MTHVEPRVAEEAEDHKMKTEKNNNELTITFKETHPTLINSIRRTIIDDVPTFAIEDVEFVANDSGLYNEIVAHRLGLVPLKTTPENYNFKSECKCGGVGCALCEVKLTLKKDEPGYVYSGEIKSNDPETVPVHEEMPVTKLVGEQKIEANCTAILGTGKEHAKWAPGHSYLKEEKDGIKLFIEGFGQYEEEKVYNKALEILQEKLSQLKKELKENDTAKE